MAEKCKLDCGQDAYESNLGEKFDVCPECARKNVATTRSTLVASLNLKQLRLLEKHKKAIEIHQDIITLMD